MKITACILGLGAALVAGHGYVDNATIGGTYYQFYQPYSDPYYSTPPQRISRAIPGNGPVEDVTSIDIQCNGYTAGGVSGSKPAPLHATAAAGSSVTLKWTLWPDSHTPLMVANSGYQYTIPSCLKPGYYLVRHEIIALHAAYSYPGAQFYPGCHQLQVTGSGTKTPTSLVAFPGAYKATDPGITYDAYKAQTYTIPGPAVFTC
ncbi:Polysaccharide monooxygenase Cel61a [Colletotrichum sp. SAR11_57]|nr:Polysaccharide monooxygenase Cel61a [Colletotrichum sp. SAR 10_96]KAI8278866.1 Polysaccharide monooxygenase Cel61a [Colletotrichum sp. SAR11_57]